MGTQKTRRPLMTYEGVTLNALNSEITEVAQFGKIKESGEKEFSFEAQDNLFSRTSERKWLCKNLNKKFNRRLTKNVETGEYKVTYTLDKGLLDQLNSRFAHEMANDLSETLEKIIFYNEQK